MEKTKKDMMGPKLYKAAKKYPKAKNPILLLYIITPIIVIIGAIIYNFIKR
ncbi:hypothetical protein [Paenibacillus abyssi]|uniref:Uncharacterized protein n=1 Tax=Paenibacillus abyssi TaxID=1340531 RepID=A0A917FT65_9BACL|nr:hypothetical protein [Paenibacillus abyssi]GGG06243.1 hypothetical protein GCM10010916_24050 [Paenibacillus abyssi]